MAEGWASNTKTVLCRYYMHGSCQQGSNCHFSHDWSHQPSNVCRFYLQGHCNYGNSCRYDHHRPLRIREQQRKAEPNKSTSQPRMQLSAHAQEFQLPSSSNDETRRGNSIGSDVSGTQTRRHPMENNTTNSNAVASTSDRNSTATSDRNTRVSLHQKSHNSVTGSNSRTTSVPSTIVKNHAPASHDERQTHQSSSTQTPPTILDITNTLSNMTVLRRPQQTSTNTNQSSGASNNTSSSSFINSSTSTPSRKNDNTSARNGAATQRQKRRVAAVQQSVSESVVPSNPNPVQLPAALPSWADAPEFIPRGCEDQSAEQWQQAAAPASWAKVAGGDLESATKQQYTGTLDGCVSPETALSELCPYYLVNQHCEQYQHCPYIHGLMCEMCQMACLHPNNAKQRDDHIKECTKLLEAEMEHSFAMARSSDKQCGICMDIVMERSLPSQRRFGILPNCSHIFCLDCIRKWRQSKQFENKIIRSCPECRIQSDYIIPSRFWVDEHCKEEKQKLVDSYKDALGKKECKYFNKGEGTCPFGNKCFYRHALADGTIKDVGPPKRRRRFDADGEVQLYLDNMILWDFMEGRESGLELIRGSLQSLLMQLEMDELAESILLGPTSDSDDSDA